MAWLEESEEHRKYFFELKSLWGARRVFEESTDLSRFASFMRSTDHRIGSIVAGERSTRRRRLVRWTLGAAAAVLLAVCAGTAWHFLSTPDIYRVYENTGDAVTTVTLDDGTGISESIAICRYFEALQPDPPLFGKTPLEQALVEMWSRRAEFEGLLAVADALRNSAPAFKNRALPGHDDYEQIPALVERGQRRTKRFFDVLEERLAHSTFLAGDFFSVADITAFVTVDFAGWIKLTLPETHINARRWYETVRARPSASA